MSELIAITFDSLEDAQRARQDFASMAHDHVVELEDSAIAYKNDKGHIRLDQTVNLTASGATHGGFWGLFVGLLFSVPAGPAAGLVMPVVSTAVGAGLGALGGKLSDFGVEDDMMKDLVEHIDAGKATLFVLAQKVTLDRVLERLHRYHGVVLRTSLPREMENKLREALTHQAA